MIKVDDIIVQAAAPKAQKEIKESGADLFRFEKRFGMESDDFYNRFEADEMGNDADFIEWASFIDMYRRAKGHLALLVE